MILLEIVIQHSSVTGTAMRDLSAQRPFCKRIKMRAFTHLSVIRQLEPNVFTKLSMSRLLPESSVLPQNDFSCDT